MKYKLDTHCHSVVSGHAYSTITEDFQYASKIGLELLAITDHAPKMPGSTHPYYFDNLKILPNNLFGVEMLKGVELNILDENGNVDLDDKILENLDLVIASLHIAIFSPKDTEKNTMALINTMKNPKINIIGHPGDPRYPIDIKSVVSTSRDTNTILEINNTSLLPNNSRAGGNHIVLEIIKECKKQSVPLILASDAHYHTYIGNFSDAQKLIDEAQFPDELILNLSVEKFKKAINL